MYLYSLGCCVIAIHQDKHIINVLVQFTNHHHDAAMTTFASMTSMTKEFEYNLKGICVSIVLVAATFVARRIYAYGKRHPAHAQRNGIIANFPPPEETAQERALLDSILPHLMKMQESIRSAKQEEGAEFGCRPESLDIVLGRMGSAIGSIFNELRDQAVDDPEYTSKQLRHRLAWEYAESTEENIRRMWYVEREDDSGGLATTTGQQDEACKQLDAHHEYLEHRGPRYEEWLERRIREHYERHPRGVFSYEHEESE